MRRGLQLLHALAIGAGAALASPIWVRGRRFERLLYRGGAEEFRGPGLVGAGRCDTGIGDLGTGDVGRSDAGSPLPEAAGERLPGNVELAMRAARALLRRLAWLPLSPWRNTCLYRSIAECQVLRRYGRPAAIRLGVRNEAPPHGPIVAHAWVIYPGANGSTTYMPLTTISAVRHG